MTNRQSILAIALQIAVGTFAGTDSLAGREDGISETARSDFPIGELSCRRGLSKYRVIGTVVGTRHTVLTVAHFTEGGSMPSGERLRGCKFRLFDADGRPRFESFVSIVSRPTVSQKWSLALDWAVLRLEEPAPVKPAEHLAISSALENGDQSLAYLHHSKGRRLIQWADRCAVSRATSTSIVLKHECPSWRGTSGSPLIVRTQTGDKVIGVQAKVGGIAVGLDGWPLNELGLAIASEVERSKDR